MKIDILIDLHVGGDGLYIHDDIPYIHVHVDLCRVNLARVLSLLVDAIVEQ